MPDLYPSIISTNTRRSTSVDLMLIHRLRRRLDNKPTLVQRLVFSGISLRSPALPCKDKFGQIAICFSLLKGLAQAKIIILFWLLNMTISCKHVHRLELQKFFNFCAAHSPVRLDIEAKFLISNYLQPCLTGECAAQKLKNFFFFAWASLSQGS